MANEKEGGLQAPKKRAYVFEAVETVEVPESISIPVKVDGVEVTTIVDVKELKR